MIRRQASSTAFMHDRLGSAFPSRILVRWSRLCLDPIASRESVILLRSRNPLSGCGLSGIRLSSLSMSTIAVKDLFATANNGCNVWPSVRTIGEAIRDARLRKRLSQDQVAELARLNRSYLSEAERGANISVDVLERLVVALDITELPIGSRSVQLVHGVDVGRFLNVGRIDRVITGAQESVDRAADAWRSEMSKLVLQEDRVDDSMRIFQLRDAAPAPDFFRDDLPLDSPVQHIGEAQDEVEVEIEAWVAAGEPLLDYSHKGESQSVPASHAPERNWKVLKARGDSMVEYGIEDGDLLYVEPRRGGVAANGELVIGWLNEGIVVKRWYRQRGKKMLISGNPNIPPRVLTPEDTWELQAIVRKSIGKTIRTRTFPKITATSRPSPSRKEE